MRPLWTEAASLRIKFNDYTTCCTFRLRTLVIHCRPRLVTHFNVNTTPLLPQTYKPIAPKRTNCQLAQVSCLLQWQQLSYAKYDSWCLIDGRQCKSLNLVHSATQHSVRRNFCLYFWRAPESHTLKQLSAWNLTFRFS